MIPRLEQILGTLNRHRVALAGFVVALTLGLMIGDLLKPAGLLEEPMAAQLIASQPQTAAGPPPVLEAFPANAVNRPWVAGTDEAKMTETPRLAASYDDRSYEQTYAQAVDEAQPDSAPLAADHAVDAAAQDLLVDEAPA